MAEVHESRVVAAPREEVWKVLADVENARRWNAAWKKIEVTSPQRHGLGTTFRAYTEDGERYDFEIKEWSPPHRISFAPLREADEKYGIVLDAHVFELSEAGPEDTLVKLTARATAHGLRGHLVARLFWPGYQRHGLRIALDALESTLAPAEEGSQGEQPGAERPADGG